MDKIPTRPTSPVASSTLRPSSRSLHDSDHHEVKVPPVTEDSLIKILHAVIHFAVRILAVLMTLIILWGVLDVVYSFYQRLIAPPFMMLTVSDILSIFGAFMVVLIAIEIFINITMYIQRDVLPIKMVIATALMAIARKAIMLDFNGLDPSYILAIAALTVALGLTYWLVAYKPTSVIQKPER